MIRNFPERRMQRQRGLAGQRVNTVFGARSRNAHDGHACLTGR